MCLAPLLLLGASAIPAPPAPPRPAELAVGAHLPDLELPTVDGGEVVRLSSYRGRPLLVVQLASWSEACREHVRVWDELTRPWREGGELAVVGIAEEQQRERAALFARWQGFDWPILWDPFDLVEASTVPAFVFVDVHGVVRDTAPHPDRFEETCLRAAFPAPEDAPADLLPPVRASRLDVPNDDRAWAYSALLFGDATHLDHALEVVEAGARTDADPWSSFRLGVAYALRHDTERARTGDLQHAFDAWTAALVTDPSQQIWRRRLQQYGPALDKPAPFYAWIESARTDLEARGTPAPELRVPLTASETATPSHELPGRPPDEESPDPKRRVPRDEPPLVTIDSAAALHSGAVAGVRVRARPSARVHIELRPDAERAAQWADDAGDPLVWIAVPSGWMVERNLLRLPPAATPTERRHLDFELVPPERVEGPTEVRAYALYGVRAGDDAPARYLRQDFRVELELPEPRF